MKLDIVLRTCGRQGVPRPGLIRIIDVPREELILKCISSVITAINNVTHPIEMKLWVLDDHSPDSFLIKLNILLSDCKIPNVLVNLETEGFNQSAYEQFRYGRDIATDLVYFIEDDYLHTPDAIQEMISAYYFFRKQTDLLEVAVYPYDNTGNYMLEEMVPTRLFFANERYWRTTVYSANTLFIHSNVVRQYWDLFETLALKFPNVEERHTINRLYNNGIDVKGPVVLFSPIPSVAVHVAYHEPNKMTTVMNDVREFYNSVSLEKLNG